MDHILKPVNPDLKSFPDFSLLARMEVVDGGTSLAG
jgi:hypothetical protein